MYPQDSLQKDSTCVENLLDGLSFWARHAPEQTALLYPRTPNDDTMESVSWMEYEKAVEMAKGWIQKTLGLPSSADIAPEGRRTVTLLIAPTHDNMCIWLALAQMGYSTQFISMAHMPNVIASLVQRSNSKYIISGGVKQTWLDESRTIVEDEMHVKDVGWWHCEERATLSGLVDRVRSGEQVKKQAGRGPLPRPFVLLHSFGSTSMPKLYPLELESANLSAQDSGKFWIEMPLENRWRRQLQTSLCFHFSFQQPVWRALTCGTALVFPVIRLNGRRALRAATSQQTKGGNVLVPSATDILDSIALAQADVLYVSPSGLERVALTVMEHPDHSPWRKAFANLHQAHTGGAPVSREMASTYEKAGLMVMQVFATTEAGMLFIGKPTVTGHLCNLTPRPTIKDHLLFYQPDPSNDTLQLWLPTDFPGLQSHGLPFEPFPGNPSIQAWNTNDTFAKIHPTAPLFEFRGRSDDWLRLTSGTACRALELEDSLMKLMRGDASVDGSANASPPLSSNSSSSLSSASLPSSPSSSSSDPKRIEAVTVLGNARKTLSAVIQLKDYERPTEKEVESAQKAAKIVTENHLQYPAVLEPQAVFFSTEERPIHITQKGSLQRKKNEKAFAPLLDSHNL